MLLNMNKDNNLWLQAKGVNVFDDKSINYLLWFENINWRNIYYGYMYLLIYFIILD